MLDTDFLFREGYLVFDLESYDIELYNELQNSFDSTIAKNSINRLRMDGVCYDNNAVKEILKKYDLDDYDIQPSHVKINSETSEYQSIVNELIPNYSHISQIWFYCSNPEQTGLQTISDKINKKISKELYNQTIKGHCVSELTLYTDGCFIESHNDGVQNFRNCVILVYLNNEWKSEDGGELIINKNQFIPPTFGKIVVLDFLHNNIEHAVNHVKNDFERYTLIKFINKDLKYL